MTHPAPDEWITSTVLAYGPSMGSSAVQDAVVHWRLVDDRYQVVTADPLPTADAEAASLCTALFGIRHQLQQRDQLWVLLIAAATQHAWWPGPECPRTHVWLYPDAEGEPTAQCHALHPVPPSDVSSLALIEDQVRYHQDRLAAAAG